MTRLVSAVLRGQPLRHRPIALRVEEQGPVRVVLEVAGREVDARPDVFPVALKPFTIGLYPGKDIAYRLGAHHQEASIDWAALPVTLAPSREYGIPRPADSPIIRELHIDEFHPIGSHMLFNCRIVSQAVPSDVPQLCHVSDMYARWRRCQDRAFVDA